MEVQDPRIKHLCIRLDSDLHGRFKLAAAANHRSLEGEVKTLIERRVKQFETTQLKEAA